MAEFDDVNPVVEGADPTSTWGSYAALLLQMIRQATPGTLYGFVIISYSTPPTTGITAWHKRCLWIKIPTPPDTDYFIYYYNANLGSFEDIREVIRYEIADGSITLDKLDPTEGTALYVLRKNAGNTAYELVPATSLFNDNEINVTRLEYATAEDYVLMSGTGGIPSWRHWAAQFELSLSESLIPVANLNDLADTGLLDQVLRRTDTGSLSWEYVDQILRANMIEPNRINWVNVKGKYLKANALGTDLEGVDTIPTTTTQSAAVYKRTVAAGAGGQAITAALETTVQFSEAVDPENFATINGSYEIALPTGTYTIDITVPIHIPTPPTNASVMLLLQDVTAANAVIATASCRLNGGANTGDNNVVFSIKHAVKITSTSNSYRVRIYSDVDIELGYPVSYSTNAETYQQMLITKLA